MFGFYCTQIDKGITKCGQSLVSKAYTCSAKNLGFSKPYKTCIIVMTDHQKV